MRNQSGILVVAILCALTSLPFSIMAWWGSRATPATPASRAEPSAEIGLNEALSTATGVNAAKLLEAGHHDLIAASPTNRVPQSPASSIDPEEFRRLEAEVVALRERIRELEVQGPTGPGMDFSNLDQAERELHQRHLELSAAPDPDRLAALIEDRLSYLERFPDRPDAKEQLKGLLGNCISLGDTDGGLQHLARFAGPVGMDSTVVLEQRAGLLLVGERYEEAKSDWRALANDGAAPEHIQASASFWAAYTERQHGNRELAKQAFEELIARFGQSEDYRTRSSVNSAKAQLKEY